MQDEMILTEEEIQTLKRMSLYWNQVSKRDDTSPLSFELQQVYGMLGIRILWIIREYVNNLTTPVPKTTCPNIDSATESNTGEKL